MIDLHLNDILDRSQNTDAVLRGSRKGLEACTSEHVPDELFIGTESLYLSEEGIIANIVDWFRRKRAEREARRKAKQKAEWQSSINQVFNSYYDWLGSIDPARMKTKEIDAYKYEDILALVNAIIKVTQGFKTIDPLKYTSMVDLIGKIRSILSGQKNFYLDKNDDLNFEPKVSYPVVKFNTSKWSQEAAVKKLQDLVIQMDNLDWELNDMGDRIVNEYNTKMKNDNSSKTRDIRKCAVCWLNFTELVSNQEISTIKAICSTLNNM